MQQWRVPEPQPSLKLPRTRILLRSQTLSFVADPEGVPVSVHSSSEWEAVTTPDATVLGVALGARAAREGVEVHGGTYSGSRS